MLARVAVWTPIALVVVWVIAAQIPKTYSVYLINETRTAIDAVVLVGSDNARYSTVLPAGDAVVLTLDAKAGEGPVKIDTISKRPLGIVLNPGPAYDRRNGHACVYLRAESIEYFDSVRTERKSVAISDLSQGTGRPSEIAADFKAVSEPPCPRAAALAPDNRR